MLEFKEVSIKLAGGSVSDPFSLVLNEGRIACVSGAKNSGKSRLLLAVLGLAPIEHGYITLDGELVTAGSGRYFRQLISYVPQHLPQDNIKVSELCRQLLSIGKGKREQISRDEIVNNWKCLGLSEDIYSSSVPALGTEQLKLVLLSLTALQKRSVILIDDPVQTGVVKNFMNRLVQKGALILYTCRENMLQCDHTVVM